MKTIKLENRVLLVTDSNIIDLTTEQYKDLIDGIKSMKTTKRIDSLHIPFINWEVTAGVEVSTQPFFEQLLGKVISNPKFSLLDLETDWTIVGEDLAEFNSSVQQSTDSDYDQIVYIEQDKVQFLSDDPNDDDNYLMLNINLSEFDISEAETILDVFNELETKLSLFALYVEGDEVDQALRKLEARIKKGK